MDVIFLGNNQKSWFFSIWFVIIMLLVFAPCGLILLWFSPIFNKLAKILITLVYGFFLFLFLLVLIIAISFANTSINTSLPNTNTIVQQDKQDDKKMIEKEKKAQEVVIRLGDEKKKDEVPQYKIVKSGDTNIGNVIRLVEFIVVDPTITESQIKAISNEVVEKIKKENKFNAIVLWFNDDARQINGYTIAKVEYAPNGNWADSMNVKTGDYKKHKYVYEFKLPKDIKNFPTNHELDIYFAYETLIYSKDSPRYEESPTNTKDFNEWVNENQKRVEIYENKVINQIAKQFNISTSNLQDIILKAMGR
jgi:Na+-transporting methylmalonyl-CoA/oxaloacetate decarboxylase gamma subunit